jgi:hypothetical protein
MANFDNTTRAKIESVHTASRMLQIISSVYTQAKSAQGLLTLYSSGSDPVFVAAVNAMLTASERSEVGAMLADLNTLITVWERDHAGVIASG